MGSETKRKVPMKVLVLGLCRTGTSSIKQALLQLGIGGAYHMHTLREERPFDAGKWLEALNRKERKMEPFSREEWDQILGHHEAVADIPASLFGAELISTYPEAKVILSVRDADKWQRSVSETIMTHFSLGTRLLAWLDKSTGLVYPVQRKIINMLFSGNFDKNGKAVFNQHNANISNIVPRERLLVFDVKDGWKPFAEFLDQEVPAGDFPRINDAQEWHERSRKRKGLALTRVMLKSAFMAAAAGIVAFILSRSRRGLL